MKLRIIPIAVTAAISAVLLFGGWYIFQNITAFQPLEQIVKDIPGVVSAKPDIGRDTVTVDITFNEDANIRKVYDTIAHEGSKVIGDRQLKLKIEQPDQSPKLNDIWAASLFDIAQAMERRQYKEIPAAMQKIAASHTGVSAVSEMDESNVYITLKDGNAVKYVVLPRNPERIGVWPDA
ncbi:hypothetical protein [Paenibacillus sp. GCM10027626]|uniref:hypothetical protein n=1 Tax=Paenibacillus sp. GCM10027626 TaxID=3273411 RepID=UPI00363779E2